MCGHWGGLGGVLGCGDIRLDPHEVMVSGRVSQARGAGMALSNSGRDMGAFEHMLFRKVLGEAPVGWDRSFNHLMCELSC